MNDTATISREFFDIGSGPLALDAGVEATGAVPGDVFTSPARFALERDTVFRPTWLYAGRADDLANPGDFAVREIEILGVSALIVRGRDNIVRAFHNACRHRGMKVAAPGCGHAAGFRCPYHSWVYDLDGSLRGVPDPDGFPGLDRNALGLVPITCAEHAGFLFITLSPSPAISLIDFLAGAAPVLERTPLHHFPYRMRLSAIVDANWKAGLDPQSEGYHVPTVHARSIRDIVTTPAQRYRKQTFAFSGPHGMLWSPPNKDFRLPADKPVFGFGLGLGGAARARPENAEGWPDAQTPSVLSIFPNVTFHPANGGWFSQELWPIDAAHHRWEATYYFREPKSASDLFAIEHAMAFNRDSGMEDFLLIPQQQAALSAGALEQVFYGENEALPRHRAACLEAIVHNARRNQHDEKPL